jgi:alanyl-tRNA synthetase
VDHLGEIRLFKILQENGISNGVRRILAVTSVQAVQSFHSVFQKYQGVALRLGVSSVDEISGKIEKMQQEREELKLLISKLQRRQYQNLIEILLSQKAVKTERGVQLIVGLDQNSLTDVSFAQLRLFVDQLCQKQKDCYGCLIVFAKPVLVVAFQHDESLPLVAFVKALNHQFEGRGGGKASFVQTTLNAQNPDAVLHWVQNYFASMG